MPIKIVSVYAASDGQTFPTENEAKSHEIDILFGNDPQMSTLVNGTWMVAHAEQIIAILTAKPDAPPKRKPRSDKGRNHKRKEKICHGAAVAAENKEAA